MNIHRSSERGHFKNDWLTSHFSFSFSNYHNPDRMGFGVLRVLNDDIIGPHQGFGTHPHSDMEIITIPFSGILSHKDSTGSTGEISAGQIQVMSAGSGITHSEFNNHDDPVELFQIWIQTQSRIEPRHETKKIDVGENKLTPIVSGGSVENTLQINQDAVMSLCRCTEQSSFDVAVPDGRGAFVMVIEGSLTVNGHELQRRDSIEALENISIASSDAYFLVIEIPYGK